MAIEKVQAQIIAEVDDQSFKQAGNEVKLFARDTKKELDKSFLFQLQLDKANTKIQLDQARSLLRKAKKDGDKEMILKMTLKTEQLQSKLTEASRSLRNFRNTGETAVSRLSRLFGGLTEQVSGMVTKLGALAVGAGLVSLGTKAIMLGDKLEQANISFTTMLGSADQAKTLLEDLTIFASTTPFELIGLRDTAKQMLAFGIEADQLIPTMKALGDVSSGLSVPIDRIALAYGQVKVAGRLMGQDLLQFTSAGVPLIAELAKNMGIAESEVKDLVSAGKVGFADVQKAFKTMTQEGGKFANLMEKQSDTLSGRWSNLKDKADSILEGIGTALVPFAKKVVGAMSFALDSLVNMWTGLRAITAVVVSGIVQSIFTIQKAWNKVSGNVKILFNGFSGTLRDFGANFGVFTRNVKTAFNNIPAFIGEALNKGIQKLENFLNKVTDGINGFAKKLGFGGELVSGISLGRIDIEGAKQDFEEFKDLNRKASAEANALLLEEMDNYEDSINELNNIEADSLREQLLALSSANNQAKKLDTELKDIVSDNIDEIDEKKGASAKKAEKEEKKEFERQKRYFKWLEEKEKERQKRIEERQKKLEKGKEIIKDYYSDVRKELDKSKDKLDNFNDKITESQSKLKELREDLAGEKEKAGVSLAERKLEIEEKLEKLKSKGLSGEEYEKQLALQKELKFIEENRALISEEAIKKAEESESERIVRLLSEKQAQIEAEILAEENRLAELEGLKEKEQEIYDGINEYRTTLEENFTKVLQLEVQKRVSELERMRVKAIETANALAQAGITTGNRTTNNNVSVNVEGTGYTNTDAQIIGNALVNTIDNSEKGINN